MSARPLATGHGKLMAQHKNLGVLLPPLPPRQAQLRPGTGDNQEDQLHAHKPKIIPRPGRRQGRRPAVSGASGQVTQVFGTHKYPRNRGFAFWNNRWSYRNIWLRLHGPGRVAV